MTLLNKPKLLLNKAKVSSHFRVHFTDFGSHDGYEHLSYHVTRVTRPGWVFYDILGMDELDSSTVTLHLRDDVSDRSRAEVVTQLSKQIKQDAKFALTIETLDENQQVLEQWCLADCRITECQFDECTLDVSDGLLIRLTIRSNRIATSLFGEMHELIS